MEHRRPDGTLSQGYYCCRCGGVTNMFGTGHGPGQCESNAELVKALDYENFPDDDGDSLDDQATCDHVPGKFLGQCFSPNWERYECSLCGQELVVPVKRFG